MLETWGMEVVKGIARAFLNPVLYGWVILTLLAGWRRIRTERDMFGIKIFDVLSEWKNTWLTSLVFGVVISLLMLGVGVVLTWQTVFVLNIIILLLSATLRFTLLSPSYTIGMTYLLLLFMPLLLEYQSLVPSDWIQDVNFQGLVILLGLLLLAEAFLTRRVKRTETYPGLVMSNRGEWAGIHRIRKLSLLPFFTLVPAGAITSVVPFWPYFSIGGESYSILMVPFMLGFSHTVRGSKPDDAAKRIGNAIGGLALVVLLLAVGSIYVTGLSLAIVIVAILGRELIILRHRVKDKQHLAYFYHRKQGVNVLAVIPGSPAARIGIEPGETILKVNNHPVHDETVFYRHLQTSGAFFRLEVIDETGETRILQSALYEDEHHELGIIFVKEPYRHQSLKYAP